MSGTVQSTHEKHGFTVLGKRHPRIDGVHKVTGRAVYIDDIKLPRMLYGKTLGSPHPHAEILSIDTSKAEQVPGVVAVITGKDIPYNHNIIGRSISDQSVLADDKVRFIGDEVAAVAAVSEEAAEKALELIDVKYRELSAVFTVEDAMQSGAPAIHAEFPNNVAAVHGYSRGDVEAAFKRADHVFENKFKLQLVDQAAMETEGIVTAYEPSGELMVWLPTQSAFQERTILSRIMGIPQHRIRIITPVIGGAFGAKDCMRLTYICAALAKKIGDGRPIKMLRKRDEEFICSSTRHPMEVYLKTGVKKDGTLTARQCKLIIDNGAYTDYGELLAISLWDLFAGTYKVEDVKYEAKVVYTNLPSGGAYRGFGNPQLSFARESQMDLIAEALNMDPLEFRLKNAVESGDVKASGWKIRSCGLKECLTKAAEGIGWKEKHGKKLMSGTKVRGVGIACGEHWSCWRGGYNTNVWRTGYATPEQLYKANPSSPYIVVGADGKVRWRPGFEMGPYDADPSSCVLIVNEDGTVNLHVSDVDRGQGSHTAFGIVAAEELGVPLEDVNVKGVDTDVGAYSPGTYASRATYVSGNAVRNAANQAKRILFKFASEMLEAPPEELEAAEGRIFVKGSPERSVRIADAAFRAYATRDGGHIIVKGYYDPDSILLNPRTGEGAVSAAWLYFAQATEVEVDVETGEVKILNVISAHDSGTVINPIGAEGQAEGAVAQGAGYALTEEMVTEKGRVLNPNFLRYIIPSTSTMPKVKTIFVDTYEPKGPFGAKGLGEPGLVAVAPSTANAINAAVGVRITELPITPEKILWALQSKKP